MVRILSEKVDAAPHPPLPMPILAARIVDMELLVLNFYIFAPNLDEINIKGVEGDLEPQREWR